MADLVRRKRTLADQYQDSMQNFLSLDEAEDLRDDLLEMSLEFEPSEFELDEFSVAIFDDTSAYDLFLDKNALLRDIATFKKRIDGARRLTFTRKPTRPEAAPEQDEPA